MKKLIFILISTITNVHSQENEINFNTYFEHNKFELSNEEKLIFINFNDSLIKANEIKSIKISGYTNDLGSEKHNVELSKKRANHIYNLLKPKLTCEFQFEGFGELITNFEKDTVQQLIKNRKVSIVYFIEREIINIKSISEYEVGQKMTVKNINFFPNSPFFLLESKGILQKLVVDLTKNNTYHIQIQGHIYDESNYKQNFHFIDDNPLLSENRAKTIYDYLIRSGIDSNRLSYVGFQGKFPLHKTPEDDRRVEIEIVKIDN